MSDPSPEYTRDLYARSPRFRLSRINAVRRHQGRPELTSLDQAKLRKPMVKDTAPCGDDNSRDGQGNVTAEGIER